MKIYGFTDKADSIKDTLCSDVSVSAYDKTRDVRSQFDSGRTMVFQGMWDTGANCSVITQKVVDALSLEPVNFVVVGHAHGFADTEEYLVNFGLPNGIGISQLRVIRGVFDDFDILIGMDIINRGDFAVSNYNGKTTFGFRIPSIADVDMRLEV
jgi:hypothetical protein